MERKPFFTTIKEEPPEASSVERHVLCPRYDACLDEAVVRNQNFCCTQCVFKQKNIRVYLTHDGMAA